MKYIGAHVSIAGGVYNAPLNAKKIGAQAFACFVKNQRKWFSKAYTFEEIDQFKINLAVSGCLASKILVHGSYLLNLAQPDLTRRKYSIDALIDEMQRCSQLDINHIVVHPGSHLNQLTEKKGLENIASSINLALAATENVILILENTAGQGANLGYRFEHLAEIIDQVEDKNRVGVCIDTCHLFAAGYDFRELKLYEKTWQQFERIIGFEYLQGMHLNDCKTELGSHKDRHESIGLGNLGLSPFKFLMADERFDEIPLILETVDPSIWEQEIKLLYSFCV